MAKFPIGRCYCRNPPGIHAKSLVVFTLMIYQPASLRILNYLRMTLSILLFYMTLTYMQTSWMISKITNWAFQLKINFNWDLRKQAQTRRLQPKIEDTLPAISFQYYSCFKSSSQKNLVIILDEHFTFCKHLNMLTLKFNTTRRILPRSAWITIHKGFPKTASWLWRHNTRWGLKCIFLPKNWIILIQCLPSCN